ncbi:MAG: hypothetical protein ACHQ49_08615 [Elusimicrobiota bacterium]
MKCPSCSAPCADDAVECPSCGLVFAKWRERQEKARLAAAEALAALSVPRAAAPPNQALWRGAAVAVVVAWIAGMALYVRFHAANRLPAPSRHEEEQFVMVRDPATGDMRRMPIRSKP